MNKKQILKKYWFIIAIILLAIIKQLLISNIPITPYPNQLCDDDMMVEMAKSIRAGKWLGKCPACGSWNTFFEQKIVESKNSSLKAEKGTNNVPQKLNSYEAKETIRTSTGFDELDRVLGGGLVKGSLILLGGEPGIGKSTLILQLCDKVGGEGQVLYVSGEESAEQIKLRADRLRNK